MILQKIKDSIAKESQMFKHISAFPDMIKEGWEIAGNKKITKSNELTFCGMGGSGIPGDFFKSILLEEGINVNVFKDYNLPPYVNSPVFLLSYSGNTEETISFAKQVFNKKLETVSVTTGGKLSELSELNNVPVMFIPKGITPRASMGYFIGVVLRILNNSGYFKEKITSLLYYFGHVLKKSDLRESGKELAKRIGNKIPIVYTSNKFYPVGYRWKTQFNENSKRFAFHNVFSEMNHNELEAYNRVNPEDYYIIILQDQEDLPRIEKRMQVFKTIAKSNGIELSMIKITGNDYISRLLSAILIGDWTTYYIAKKDSIDPSSTEVIEGFKKDILKE